MDACAHIAIEISRYEGYCTARKSGLYLIDRDAVAGALATDVLSGDTVVYRLLDLLEAEAWARSWSG
jgi:hypothetical protein